MEVATKANSWQLQASSELPLSGLADRAGKM
jgi:hypothetical protein